jgi:hypothetical protein
VEVGRRGAIGAVDSGFASGCPEDSRGVQIGASGAACRRSVLVIGRERPDPVAGELSEWDT